MWFAVTQRASPGAIRTLDALLFHVPRESRERLIFTTCSFCSRLLFQDQSWLSQMTHLAGKFVYNCVSFQCGLMWLLKMRTKFSGELFPQTFQWRVEGQQGSRQQSSSSPDLYLCFHDSVSPVYLFQTDLLEMASRFFKSTCELQNKCHHL